MDAEATLPDIRRRRLVLGLGCERGTPADELLALAASVVSRSDDIAFVATLDVRAEEPAMQAVAKHYAAPLVTFPATRLEAETPRLLNPSDIVFAYTGCHGVAEAAALAQAGEGGQLVVGKTKSANATAAIAESFQKLAPSSWDVESAPSQNDSIREPA